MKDNIFDLIDQYANGELNERQSTEVEAKINSDPEYKRLWDYHQTLRSAISHSKLTAEAQAPNVSRQSSSAEPRQLWIKLTAAASVIALIGLLLYLFLPRIDDGTLVKKDPEWESPTTDEEEGIIGSSGNRLQQEISYTELKIEDDKIAAQKSARRTITIIVTEDKNTSYQLYEKGLELQTSKSTLKQAEAPHWVLLQKGSEEQQCLRWQGKWYLISYREEIQALEEIQDASLLPYLEKVE